jgi:hypothetical protein
MSNDNELTPVAEKYFNASQMRMRNMQDELRQLKYANKVNSNRINELLANLFFYKLLIVIIVSLIILYLLLQIWRPIGFFYPQLVRVGETPQSS